MTDSDFCLLGFKGEGDNVPLYFEEVEKRGTCGFSVSVICSSHPRCYQVLHQLPRKVESVKHCALTPEQSELYHKEVELGRKEMKNGRGE